MYSPLHGPSQFFLLLLHQEFGFLFLQMPPHAQQKVGGGLGSTYFPLMFFHNFSYFCYTTHLDLYFCI